MSEIELGFESKFQRIVDDVNDLRIAIGSLEFGQFEEKRFVQFERLNHEGKKAIAKQYGTSAKGLDVVDASEYQMRLSGMSSSRASKSAEMLGELVFMSHNDRVPGLMMGNFYSGVNPYIVLFGNESGRAPYLSAENPVGSKKPYLKINHPGPEAITARESMRAHMADKPWKIGFFNDGPNFSNLSVIDDPEEFTELADNPQKRNIILVGATAIAEVLPKMAGPYGTSESLEVVKSIVLNSVNGEHKIKSDSLENTVNQLLEHFGRDEHWHNLPVNLHGKILDQFSMEDLRTEIIYSLVKQSDPRVVKKIAEDLLWRVRYDAGDGKASTYGRLVARKIQTMLSEVGYKKHEEFADSIVPAQVDKIAVEYMEKSLFKKSWIERKTTYKSAVKELKKLKPQTECQ